MGAADSSEALDVSVDVDGGTIVGSASLGGQQTGFIWDPVNGMRELSVVLEAAGIDLRNVDIRTVLSVSDDGLNFVGIGFQGDIFDPDSPGVEPGLGTLVWVATIPEPSTATLLAMGLAILSARGARLSERQSG